MSVDAYLMWGSTTVQLANGTLSYLTGYDTGMPSMGSDGRVTVTDQLRLRLLSVVSTMISTVMSINQMLERVAERKEKPQLAKVYLVRCLDGVNVWRSEIVNGRVNINSEGLHALGRKPEVELVIERLNYWESTTLTEIALANGSTTGAVIGGVTVYPWDDTVAGRDNWVEVGSSFVSGDLEAPVRLELENTYNDSSRTGSVYLGVNWNSSPANLVSVLEGEAGTGGSILPASPDTTLFSGGQYKEITVPLASTSIPLYWTLDSTNLGYYGGNYFNVLLRLLNSVQAGTWAQMKVTIASLITLFETPAFLLPTGDQSNTLLSLGRVQLPPYLTNAGTAIGSLRLELHLWRAAGSYTQAVDYIQLMPMDAFRKIDDLGFNLEYEEKLIDDGVEDCTYAIWKAGILTSAGAYGYHIPYGEALRIKPGVSQKVYISVTGAEAGYRTSKVKLYYRARRQTL